MRGAGVHFPEEVVVDPARLQVRLGYVTRIA